MFSYNNHCTHHIHDMCTHVYIHMTRARTHTTGKKWTMEELEYVLEHGEQLSKEAVKEAEDMYKVIPNMDK